MKHRVVIVALALIGASVLSSCSSVFGAVKVEQAGYKVVEEDGLFEVRDYKDHIVASTVVEGKYRETSNVAFRRVAGYIFGKNKSRENGDSVEIAMTAPVLQSETDGAWTMSFVLPSEYTFDELPIPKDPKVTLHQVKGKRYAVISYSGLLSAEAIESHAERLRAWMRKQGLEGKPEVVSAGYNPPWTLPFLRRNEVMIEVNGGQDREK